MNKALKTYCLFNGDYHQTEIFLFFLFDDYNYYCTILLLKLFKQSENSVDLCSWSLTNKIEEKQLIENSNEIQYSIIYNRL